MWVMPLVGEPPCQCFSPGGIQTTSPGRISRTGSPCFCTRPTPEMTYSVWPSGCECQLVRAPGAKETRAGPGRAGASVAMSGSCHTVPVKYSFGAWRVGREPARWMSMDFLLVVLQIPHGEEALSRQGACAVRCAVSNHESPRAAILRGAQSAHLGMTFYFLVAA